MVLLRCKLTNEIWLFIFLLRQYFNHKIITCVVLSSKGIASTKLSRKITLAFNNLNRQIDTTLLNPVISPEADGCQIHLYVVTVL